MKLITKTRVRRALIPLAALAVAAAIVPTAGAANCTASPGANCQNQDMRHLGNGLKGADMTGADMRGADMRNMNLANINLTNADMRGAKLSGAKMNGANLTGAMMNGVKMKNVQMKNVKMIGTKLHKATLTNVKIDNAIIRDMDVSGARFIGGGMTNSSIVGMKSVAKRSTRSWCANGPGSGTQYSGSGIGWAWENDYSFSGSTLSGDYSCAHFNGITWGDAMIINADFSGTVYDNAQNNSEQIIAMNVDFGGSRFNDKFWRPALAFGINLDSASCPPINNDQRNAVWGRYDAFGPYWIGSTQTGHWAYGNVASTFYGNIVFDTPPVVVNLSRARQSVLSSTAYSIPKPWIHGASNCVVADSALSS